MLYHKKRYKINVIQINKKYIGTTQVLSFTLKL